MTQTAINYGTVLWQLGIAPEDIRETKEIWESSEPLRKALDSPVVPLEEKNAVIRKVFPKPVHAFLQVVCKYAESSLLSEMFQAYQECSDRALKIVRGELYCVEEPDEEQLNGIRQKLCRQYGAESAELEIHKDPSLLAGFVLRVGDIELDESVAGRWKRLNDKLTRR